MTIPTERVERALSEVRAELIEAVAKFPPFRSGHEGYAVMLEEMDELWEAVRSKRFSKKDQYNEAMQVAAMAIRFMVDIGQK